MRSTNHRVMLARAVKTALVASFVGGCSVIASFDGLEGDTPTVDAGTETGSADGGEKTVVDGSAPSMVDSGVDGIAPNPADASDGAVVSAYAMAVLADRPELFWRFEDPSTIVDSSGNGHTGTVIGGVMLGAKGAIAGGGHGASFTAGAISGGQILPFTGNAPFSVEAWITISSGSYQCFLGRELDPNDGYSFFVYAGQLILERENSSTVDHATSNGILPTNIYVHVVGTYDGTTMRVYINGVMDGSQASSIALPGASSVPFFAGDNNDGGTSRFTGLLDEVAIYSTALSDAQITNHFKVGTGAK